MFKDDYDAIRNLQVEDDAKVRMVLKSLLNRHGIGLVYASAILTILRPSDFGIANRHVILALKDRGIISKEFELTTVNKLIIIEKVLRCEAENLNATRDERFKPKSFNSQEINTEFTPRYLDVALWGLGKWMKKNRCRCMSKSGNKMGVII